MNLGDLAIKLSAVFALLALVHAIRWARGRPGAERWFRSSYHAMAATLLAASALLMVAILGHDFRLAYVYGYTSRDLPLVYLISAFWAGQQGTYLLWALCGALMGYLLLRRRAWQPARVMCFWVPTVGFMHLLMLDPNGNPFRRLAELPPDGRGLNPLLQDPWMASHPPLVFLGYVAATVPAVLAAVALLRRDDREWLEPALRWAIGTFLLLGGGIVLGGFWAYKVLGWGGYWGWDPVENASLVPWIVVTALIHGLLVQRATGALPRSNLALALAGYVLVFYATFLTRSGVLADFSVHSFPAGSVYRILLGIQLVIVCVAVGLLLRRGSIAARQVAVDLSWPLALSVAVLLLIVSAGMVLIGTSWPIVSTWAGNASAFGAAWYNRVSLPIYIVLLAVLAVAPSLGWTARPGRLLLRRAAPALAIALTGTLVAVALGIRDVGPLLLYGVALGALAANLFRLIEVARGHLLGTGAALAHLGFALMLVGVVASGTWGLSAEARLPQDQPVEVLGHTLTFRGHVAGSTPRDRWRIDVGEPSGRVVETTVGMFATGQAPNEQVLHQPAILRHLRGDLYVAPSGLEVATNEHQELELLRGRPVSIGGVVLTFAGFEAAPHTAQRGMTVRARLELRQGEQVETLALPYTIGDGAARGEVVRPAMAAGIVTLQLTGMQVEQGLIAVHADLSPTGMMPALSVAVSTKPLIGLLWAGTLLLGLGCTVALARRLAEARTAAATRIAAADRSTRRPRVAWQAGDITHAVE